MGQHAKKREQRSKRRGGKFDVDLFLKLNFPQVVEARAAMADTHKDYMDVLRQAAAELHAAISAYDAQTLGVLQAIVEGGHAGGVVAADGRERCKTVAYSIRETLQTIQDATAAYREVFESYLRLTTTPQVSAQTGA